MTGGCSGMLIQFPIMMGVYFVNYKILSYVLNIKDTALEAVKSAVRLLPEYAKLAETSEKNAEYRIELLAIEHFEKLDLSAVPAEVVEKMETFIEKFQLFGIDLSRTPSTDMGWDLLWLIPILTGVTSLMMGVYTWLRQKKTNPEMAKNPSSGCMTLMSPAMSVYFSFLFPASVGIYIIMSSALSFIQMVITNKVLTPKKMLAKAMVEETINRRAKEKVLKSVAEKKNEN
jgi:YidC/Oxa1 family membrane protein insertase